MPYSVLRKQKRSWGLSLILQPGTPLQNVSITLNNSPRGGLTDAAGKFSVSVDKSVTRITFSYTGYHSVTYIISDESTQELTILLSKSYTTLKNVVVNAKKGKYKNKNNPAVELIRHVIANKSRNGPGANPYSSYKEYEKTQMLTDGPWIKITQNFVLKKFKFFFENTDTTIVPGKKLNSIYLQEILSNKYVRKNPVKNKKIIIAQKTVDYGEYIDMKGIQGALHYLYNDINIYDNNISAFTMQFVSPISDVGPVFYMYFIQDTIVENGSSIVKLDFTPRNPEDLLFRGTLWVTLDGTYAVTSVELGMSKHVNMNYVRNFELNQNFKKGPGEHYYLAESDMLASFSPFSKSPGVFGERKISISDLSDSVLPDHIFQGSAVDSLPKSSHQSDSFWRENRPVPLSPSQAKTYSNADSLVKMRSYRRLMDLATLYFVGYKSAGKFDIGPIQHFILLTLSKDRDFNLEGEPITN